MKAYLFLLFSIIFLLTACIPSSKRPYNSKAAIRYDINSLTSINLDTSKFEVLMDSIHHTEGAFDSDYTWYVKIKFSNEYFDTIKNRIRYSRYFGKARYYGGINWKKVDTTNLKGVWFIDSNKFEFIQRSDYLNPEPIYLNVDTVNKMLDLTLIHL